MPAYSFLLPRGRSSAVLHTRSRARHSLAPALVELRSTWPNPPYERALSCAQPQSRIGHCTDPVLGVQVKPGNNPTGRPKGPAVHRLLAPARVRGAHRTGDLEAHGVGNRQQARRITAGLRCCWLYTGLIRAADAWSKPPHRSQPAGPPMHAPGSKEGVPSLTSGLWSP